MNTSGRRRDGDDEGYDFGYIDGYVDHHVHFLSSVAASVSVDVSGARNVPEVLECLAGTHATASGGDLSGGWIRGWGYDEALLDERRHPTRGDLDRVGLLADLVGQLPAPAQPLDEFVGDLAHETVTGDGDDGKSELRTIISKGRVVFQSPKMS